MKVMKFGGTSVGSAERIKNVASLITKSGKNIVVLLPDTGDRYLSTPLFAD